MGRFSTVVSREEHSCEPLPGKFDRFINGLKEGSVIKCQTSGCGQYWELIMVTNNAQKSKLTWVKTNAY